MKVVVQRVSEARVGVDGRTVSSIGPGLLMFAAFRADGGEEELRWMARKCLELRIFEDGDGQMNRSLLDIKGEMLVISQFTLYGDCRKGRRPSFVAAAEPEKAESLYEYFIEKGEKAGIRTVPGKFQAMMDVSLVNSGPVTILVDSKKAF